MEDTKNDGGLRRPELRLSAALLFAGVVASLLAGLQHPDAASANDHPATFAEYAASDAWILVHLGQFVGMGLLLCGLLVLAYALNVRHGPAGWAVRLGTAAAVAALALYGVLQGVDGVALKHAVDAWAGAAEGEKALRFAAAEDIRWLEWGVRSYQSFMLGSALILFGSGIAATRRVSRFIGYLMALSGAAYLAQGWIIGAEGFSASNSLPTLAGIVLILGWTGWLLVAAWRRTADDKAGAPASAG
ncbi:hypothetical protein ASF98_15065 [Arthrobacter sp. Leaf337]|uniref:DUF4386 family protein n=1 Tax=Arthrobacter sp. Leaf337 TaxID=1736342 RepID=UPI0006FBE33A|nr:DUF4386 family protein [Arthrobacter sp. Leaf337]KQR62252.1 hypothetical protein ASF98_15065 [Arthrobacter sp. Leaf337]